VFPDLISSSDESDPDDAEEMERSKVAVIKTKKIAHQKRFKSIENYDEMDDK
jgi:hypothetical protein